MDQIVLHADVSKGTFFNYFDRKEAILDLVLERRTATAESAAAEIMSLAIPIRDQLLTLFAEAARAWEEDRDWSRHALEGLGARVGPTGRGRASTEQWRELIRRCVERGQRSGEFRATINPSRAEAMLSAIYHDALLRWGTRAEFALEAELRELLMLALDGLAE